MQAVDLEGLDMELDLSNLGTVNTMFAALFRYSDTSLGVGMHCARFFLFLFGATLH